MLGLQTRFAIPLASYARTLMEHAGREGAATLPNGAILRVTLADSGGAGDFEIARLDHLDPRPETA